MFSRITGSKHRRTILSLCSLSLILMLTLLFAAPDAFSASATLSWDAPTTNTDGSPLADLAGYKLYYGTSSGSYSQTINVGTTSSYTVTGLLGGTYYFAVTAYDSEGNESAYSNEVSKAFTTQYTLTVSKAGTGTGTVTGSGISCGTDCSEAYDSGTVVTLTATASSGSQFSGWSGGGCSGTGQCVTSMTASKTVTATFTSECGPFSDVTCDNWANSYINAIYTAGITVGCGEGKYCASDTTTRGQIAVAIVRALYGEDFTYTQSPYFSDVPSSHPFFKYIQKVKDAGITTVTEVYSVDAPVTRDQMAAFLARAFLGMQ